VLNSEAFQDGGQAALGVGNGFMGSVLTRLMLTDDILPGSDPGYQTCKTIFTDHPLGLILANAPITRAQTKPRELSCKVLGEAAIVKQFMLTWDRINKSGATVLLNNLCSLSRVYCIASIGVGEVGKDLSTPLDVNRIADADLFFTVLDPLNTAGSLVLNQDPNSPDFLKVTQPIVVNGKTWHPSRTFVKINEQPIYIAWTNSAFGFVGRSVYQRALFPLKTYLEIMLANNMVAKKIALLVAKMESPSSFLDNVIGAFFGQKRGQLKSGVNGQVLSIGVDESVESLNFQNLEGPLKLIRDNVIQDIASAVPMPASIISHEAFNKGMAEGTEDAKKENSYLDYVRQDMNPAYAFIDAIVMRKAWTPEFFETLKSQHPKLKFPPFETWLYECMSAFVALWPNLQEEPDSEKAETAKVKMESVTATAEVLIPIVDPVNAANVVQWIADNVNEMPELFAGKLDIDVDALEAHLESKQALAEEAALSPNEGQETKPTPFSKAS